MARYRDARNETGRARNFDNDRHAAFWRGLADAGAWKTGKARARRLEARRTRCCSRYQPDWPRPRHPLGASRGGAGNWSRLDQG